jgi:hypothetical protein
MFVTGDKVVLVDDRWPAFIAMYDNIPHKNKTYTVRDVRLGRGNVKNSENPEDDTEVAITLEGVQNGPDPLCESGLIELAFKAIRFRKVEEIQEQKKAVAHQTQPTLF